MPPRAMVVCDKCGYRVIGAAGLSPDESLKAAIAGLQIHEDTVHAVPMTPDRFITALRIGGIKH